MPVLRSAAANGGAGKISRKVRVALGNSKSPDDFKTLRPKIRSDVDRKSRVATEESQGSRDGARTSESKINASKKMKSRVNDNASVSCVNSNEKSGKRKKDFRTDNEHQGFEAVIDVKSGQKRKRTYADPGIVEDRIVDDIHKKTISKPKHHVSRLYLDRGKKEISRGKNRELEDTIGKASSTGRTKFNGIEGLDKKSRMRKAEGADKLKHVQENGLGNGTLRSSDKRTTLLAKKNDVNKRTYAVGLIEKPRKKYDHGRKILATDSGSTEVLPPKKKKKVMRIDPHDVSNKRLNDGINDNGNSQAKIDSEESINVESSKNAQFRAIRPSSSILSYVEDNLLGRRRDIDFRRAGYNIQLSAPLDNIPFSTCTERERIEVPVFRNNLEFFAAAKISTSFPAPDLPEIAFAGRSNVGKSSLLNALTRQWGVVRTSDKPGLTQTINFFKLGPKLSLVDLPGYGFAYAKEEVKEAWEELVKEYVTTRVGLKRVCILVDTKWGMRPRDFELIDAMERSQTKYQVVLTKTDLVFPIDVARRAMQIEENLKAKKSAVQPLMMVSSKTGAGIRSLRTVLANVARLVR